jgi:peptide/nickel transport system substrate-binding protein
MDADSYWSATRARRASRRRLISWAAAGGAGLAASPLLACSRGATSAARSSGSTQSSNQAAQDAPRPGGTFNAYLPYNAPLDPHKVSANAQQAVSGVLSRLFRFKTGSEAAVIADHNIEPDLAVSVEAPDAETWTVKLRPDAKFHNLAPVNGHAVEAADIKATFTRALDPATGNPNRGSLNMIDPAQIQTPDATTVVFKLAYPYAPFQKMLASPTYSWIFPREILAGGYDPSKVVIGSGPFTLESYTPDVAYIYRKNPDWFEKGKPYVDSVRVAVLPDVAQQLAQFSSGSLDEYMPAINDLDTAKQRNPKATVIKADNGSPYPLYFQLGDPASPFQDIRVRQAFSMAIDRDALSKVIYNGQTELTVFVPAYMGKWAQRLPDLDPGIGQYYKYNPAEAKKLLDAAGAGALQLKIAYIVNGGGNFGPTYVKMGETIANMLNAAGVKTTLVQQDYNKDFIDTGRGSRQGYFDADTVLFAAVGFYTDADEWLFSYFHSKSTSNGEHLKDAALDAMIDKMRTIASEDDRLKAVLDIQRYIAQRVYVVPTVGTYQWVMVQPRVRNYQYSSSLGRDTETYAKLAVQA